MVNDMLGIGRETKRLAMTGERCGFTILEIMIVVFIIGLLAAVAIPNYVKYRTHTQRVACLDNMRVIDDACEQARLEGIVPTLDASESTGIFGSYIRGTAPKCPADKVSEYSLGEDGHPVCGNPKAEELGHVLE